MSRHGLRPATVRRTLGHLARAVGSRTPWRLAFALEECQADLFLHHDRELSPEFAIFFVNSVAHVQHNYWREMRPELFDEPLPAERLRHRTAIPAGYRHLDRLLARVLRSVPPETTILLCSALGQQPYRPDRNGRGPVVLRVDDLDRLIQTLELPVPREAIRTMAGSFTLDYDEPDDAARAVELLKATRVVSQALFRARRHGTTRALVDLALTHELRPTEPVRIAGHRQQTTLGDLVSVAHHKSGEHSPAGLLWARGPFPLAPPDPEQPVPLTEVAPAILRFFELPTLARRTG